MESREAMRRTASLSRSFVTIPIRLRLPARAHKRGSLVPRRHLDCRHSQSSNRCAPRLCSALYVRSTQKLKSDGKGPHRGDAASVNTAQTPLPCCLHVEHIVSALSYGDTRSHILTPARLAVAARANEVRHPNARLTSRAAIAADARPLREHLQATAAHATIRLGLLCGRSHRAGI